MNTRREFLWNSVLLTVAGGMPGALAAAMKYDRDGVLCIPREIAYDVLLRAEGIERNEVDIFSWVRQGDTISEIIDKGGYF